MLVHENWRYREAGILALGAVSEGCRFGMQPYLPELFPFLFNCLKDPKPLVRSITCWTLGRYTSWVVDQVKNQQQPQAAQQNPAQYFELLMTELLQRVLDTNKKVQDAACSAFATLEEEALDLLVPYLGPIVQNLMYAFGKYQAKNLNILYDTIGTLADSVGRHLQNSAYVQTIMVPVMQRLESMDDSDRSMYPVLECLASITQAVGLEFQAYALNVWNKCHSIIHTALTKHKRNEDVEQELIVCSLDLLSAICEGLQNSVESLVAQQSSQVLTLLLHCMDGTLQPDVRQSAFALVGDLSKHCIQHLGPFLPQYLPQLVASLTLSQEFERGRRGQNPMISVCNNACWAVGELTTKIGEENIRPFAPQILPALIHNLQSPGLNPSLLQNTAITIGRLALVCPVHVAPQLDSFAVPWCYRMSRMRDDMEKDHACRGLCNMIQLNAEGIIKAFIPFLLVVASWAEPPPDLRAMFEQIIEAFVLNYKQPLSNYLAHPKALEHLGGAQGVQMGIGWDSQWHQASWDVQHLANELMMRGYKIN
jgi:transportin-1